MTASHFRLAALVALASGFLLGACAAPEGMPSTTPQLDSSFGESVRQARALQTIDPDAGRKAGPVAGIDGEAAKRTVDEYHKSFQEPPRTFNILGIGGSSSGSAP